MRGWVVGLWLALSGCSGAMFTEHFFVQADDGYNLKVVLEGNPDGEAIVLVLHGGPVGGSFGYNSGSYAVALEEQLLMAYLDQRSQGASQGAYDWETYGISTAARDVHTVVQVLASRFPDKRVYLLGHSWGGMLGTATLVETDAQDQVAGWIEAAGCHDSLREPAYVEGQIRAVAPEQIKEGDYGAEWESALAWLDDFDETAESFESSDLTELNALGYELEGYVDTIEWEPDGWPGEDGSLWFRYAARPLMGLSVTGAGIGTLYDEAEVGSFSDRLGEIAIPGLYLYAKYDFVCPPALGVDAARANASGVSTVVTFENSGHSLMSNEPTLFVDSVLDFVEQTR